jgi:thiamine-phosphate diphosphorylase/hydroxyethylthiazole kinase
LGNALRTLHGCVAPSSTRKLDGLAVVSAIAASLEPRTSAQKLISVFRYFLSVDYSVARPLGDSTSKILSTAAQTLSLIKKHTPLVHQVNILTLVTVSDLIGMHR